MNAHLYLLTFAHFIRAVAGTEHFSLESHLLGEVLRPGRRTCRLYCRVGIGFHLQIHPDGRVNGTHEPNRLSVLELFAVSQGVVGIKGVISSRFLAMNRRGRLHATERFTDDCMFRERFQDNSYTIYASVVHMNLRTGRQWLVALNKRGKAKMGSSPRVKSHHASAHFLPRATLHGEGERGFTITDRSQEKPKTTPGSKVTGVKYWPKYRFG